jgi:two-component system cell cycle sensor histidine kinase/response regulator CckA
MGWSADSIIGTDWFARTAADPSDAARARGRYVADIQAGEASTRHEGQIRSASGDERKVLWTSTVLRHADGAAQGVCWLGLDITRQVQLEAELLQQTKLESLGRLAASVAHDFNNLLAVMKLEMSVLAERDADGRRRESQDAMLAALDQATALTRSLLVYGRKTVVAKEALDIDVLLRDATPLLRAVAGDVAKVTLAPNAAGARVLVDPTQMRQIVLNLVGNAVDATRASGGHVLVTTHVEFVDEATARQRGAPSGGEYFVLTVADDGSGIGREVLPRVFDPFFTTKLDGRGTGLGLPMCRSIVERAAGFIVVESTEGVGTTFRVYLPKDADERTSRVPTSRAPTPRSGVVAAGRPAGKLVLVVEDVESIRDFVVDALRTHGYRVLAAADSTSAAYTLASEPVDLLVTDGHLPDGSGNVLARSARVVRPELRVLLMSGTDIEASEGFDGVLSKPFSLDSLLTAVADALDPGALELDPDGTAGAAP